MTIVPAWTTDKIELLQQLWKAGKSAGCIAAELLVTRNAVMGKIVRLKLGRHLTTATMTDSKPAKKKPAPDVLDGDQPPVEYLQLESHHCRAPVPGIGSDGLMLSCGRRQQAGSSYCPYHDRLFRPGAYQVMATTHGRNFTHGQKRKAG